MLLFTGVGAAAGGGVTAFLTGAGALGNFRAGLLLLAAGAALGAGEGNFKAGVAGFDDCEGVAAAERGGGEGDDERAGKAGAGGGAI